MIYQSLTEIFDDLDRTRETIYQRVGGLAPEQYGYKEEAGRWSVAGVIEHIGGAEALIAGRLRVLIEEAKAAGQLRPVTGGFRPVSTDEIRSRSTLTQFQAPEALRPKGELSFDQSLERIRSTRRDLLELRPRFEQLDLSEVKFPHPAFGPLDAYEWLALIVLHESRHLGQIERILSCPGFPCSNVS